MILIQIKILLIFRISNFHLLEEYSLLRFTQWFILLVEPDNSSSFPSSQAKSSSASSTSFSTAPIPELRSEYSPAPTFSLSHSSPSSSFASFHSLHLSTNTIDQSRDYMDDSDIDEEHSEEAEEQSSSLHPLPRLHPHRLIHWKINMLK